MSPPRRLIGVCWASAQLERLEKPAEWVTEPSWWRRAGFGFRALA